MKYYKMAAENGKKDVVQAFRWLLKASEAKQPDSETFYFLGLCYKNGTGTRKDIPTAVMFFEKAQKMLEKIMKKK